MFLEESGKANMLSRIIQAAKDLGFIKVGFSRCERPMHLDRFQSWISGHKNADMTWLEKNIEIREDPSLLLPGCRVVISLAYPYPSSKPCTSDGYTVSRYSQPNQEDYHQNIKTICKALVDLIGKIYPGSKSRICVDSAPILERSFAYSSGIGFVGKNNMLIIPDYGSYFFLAEILTTAPPEFLPAEIVKNQCGSCRACLDSCPTGALEQSFHLNASKCLSYLTIEDKTPVDLEIGKKMGDCFFGCDRCQEVCLFNKEKESRQVVLPSTSELLQMDQDEFNKKFGESAFARQGLEKLRSNILIMLGQFH